MTGNSIDSLKSYREEQYSSGITNAKLAAVALLKLEEIEVERTFENVVVGLQKLFPGKFSLITYPEFPDTIRVDNTLRLDAGKGHAEYLTGNRPKGYKLTAMGRIAGGKAIEELNLPRKSKGKKQKVSGTDRNRYTRLVTAVTKSEAFEKFSTKQFSEIQKFDVCRVLHCTLETPSEKMQSNLKALESMATDLHDIKEYEKLASDVLELLNYIKKNWERLQND